MQKGKETLRREREERLEKLATKRRNKRIRLVGLVFSLLMTGLVGRIFYIKYTFGEEYEKLARANQFNKKNVESITNPNRGSILDRNGQSLAISTTVYNIIMDVRSMAAEEEKNKDSKKTEIKEAVQNTLNNVSNYLEIPVEELREYMKIDPETGKPVKDTQYLIIKKKVPQKTKVELMESGVLCIYAEEDTSRSYVHNGLAADVIGFIRGDSMAGVEKQYNTELTGVAGRLFRYYDSSNNTVTNQIPAKDGYTLLMTLDMNIQQLAEKAVLKVGEEYQAQNAEVIVMNPKTGELLALAEYPSFNLNDPMNLEYITATGLRNAMSEMPEDEQTNEFYKIWGNYAISSTFEPGSIYKPIVAAAALEENVISKDSIYYCGGSKVIYDQVIPCNNVYGHGQQTLVQALANSCNVAIMDIGEQLGRDRFHKYQHDFGFGELTGIDLPGEANSILHTLSGLGPVEIQVGAMGQGFNATAIQSLNSFSAVINGGNLMRPYVVSQVIDKNGNIVKENTPKVQRKVISENTSNFMREALQSVFSPTGTGRKAIIKGYAIGGKTGTAQQGVKSEDTEDEHVLSFIAYLPVEDPNIIAMVVIDRPLEYIDGITSPGPTMQQVLLDIIKYEDLRPTGTEEETSDIILGDNAVFLENYVGKNVSEVINELNRIGIEFDCIGSGDIIGSQMPAGGIKVSRDSRVYLNLKSSGDDIELNLVPDVKNLDWQQAAQILESAGFAPNIESDILSLTPEEASGESEPQASPEPTVEPELEYVYLQMPGAGIKLPPNTEIKLKVRAGEQ